MTFSRYAISVLILALASACGSDARELAPDDAAGWQVEPDADVVTGDASRDSSATDPADAEAVDAAPDDADADAELDAEPVENDASETPNDGGEVAVDADAAHPGAKVLWAYAVRTTKNLGYLPFHEQARATVTIDLTGTIAGCEMRMHTEWYDVGGAGTSLMELSDADRDCLQSSSGGDRPLWIRWSAAGGDYPGNNGPGYDLYRPGSTCGSLEYPSEPVPVDGECVVPDLAAANRLAWRHTVHQLDADAVDETWELVDLSPK